MKMWYNKSTTFLASSKGSQVSANTCVAWKILPPPGVGPSVRTFFLSSNALYTNYLFLSSVFSKKEKKVAIFWGQNFFDGQKTEN